MNRTILLLTLLAATSCVRGTFDDGAPDPTGDDRAPAPPGRVSQASSTIYKSKPGENVTWLNFPKQKSLSGSDWGSMLTDIENHLPASYGTTYRDSDKITWGHETSHGIHAHVRNAHYESGKRLNALYVGGDKAALIDEPKIRKSQVAAFIPASLRASRYSTYVTGQVEWDDTPLYLWDEWNAYVNGGAVGTDLVESGLWKGDWRDGVNGQLEFTVYGTAVAMAVEKYDPTYFAANVQFFEFMAYEVRRAMTIYRKGAVMKPFAWAEQDAYYKKMRSSADAADWRAFCVKVFGEDFVNEAIFGDPPKPGPVDPGDAGPPADTGPAIDAGPAVDAGPTPTGDADGDGVPDATDLCSSTPAGANVWTYGEWIGCAAGQRRDAGPFSGADADGDGVSDAKDLCGATPACARVGTYGDWIGCAAGQHRDK